MVLLEFSITPLGKGESVGRYVARALDIVDRSGVAYRTHAMGTILEGSWDEVCGVVARCFRALQKDCHRISLTVKVDYRKGKRGRLRGKTASVERRLGRKLQSQ